MTSADIRICLVGAGGQMGQRCLRLLAQHPQLRLGTCLLRPQAAAPQLGGQVVPHTDDPETALAHTDLVIDFSAPAVAPSLLPASARRRLPYVLASTGLDAAAAAAIAAAASTSAVLVAANLSLGVNVMLGLVQRAAAQLDGFAIEIAELHHRRKRDAPSGTALALGQAAQAGAGALQPVLGRQGSGAARRPNELGYAALRGGDVAGEHTVYYLGQGERLEITHRAHDADIFARGALHAASWLHAQPPGRYSMQDVLASP